MFGKGMLGMVGQTISESYVNLVVNVLILPWRQIGFGIVAGVAASLAAAALPIREGLRITPHSAIRMLPLSEDRFLLSRHALYLSAGLITTAIIFYFLLKMPFFAGLNPQGIYLVSFLLVSGLSLLAPYLLRGLLELIHRMGEERSGPLIRLAGLSLQKHLGRNAMAVGAILFSVAMFVATSAFIGSMKRSILDSFVDLVRADFGVTAGHPIAAGGGQNTPMPEEIGEDMKTLPGVLSVDPVRIVSIEYKGIQHRLLAFDVQLRRSYSRWKMADGEPEPFRPLEDRCLVSEGFANLHNVRRGDIINLPTPSGLVPFRIDGIAVDYTSDTGSIIVDWYVFKKHWGDHLVDTFAVRVQPGSDPDGVRAELLDRFGKERKLFVLSRREYISTVLHILDQPFAAMGAIEAVALLIGGFGIIVALLASIAERTREIGMLRSVGATRRQVTQVIVIEASFLGLVGGFLGVMSGLAVSWVLLNGLIRRMFGASVLFDLPGWVIPTALIAPILISALSGLYPARRAAKTNIVEALAYE